MKDSTGGYEAPLTVLAGVLLVGSLLVFAAREHASSAPAATPAPAGGADYAVAADIRYARNGDVSLAYQVTGEGPLDLVFVSGFVSHQEVMWDDPGRRPDRGPHRVLRAADPLRQARPGAVRTGSAGRRRSRRAWTTCAR